MRLMFKRGYILHAFPPRNPSSCTSSRTDISITFRPAPSSILQGKVLNTRCQCRTYRSGLLEYAWQPAKRLDLPTVNKVKHLDLQCRLSAVQHREVGCEGDCSAAKAPCLGGAGRYLRPAEPVSRRASSWKVEMRDRSRKVRV
jgi:hypothetical protein